MSETAPVRNEDTIDRDRLAVATAAFQGILANASVILSIEQAAADAVVGADALLAKLSAPRPVEEVNAELVQLLRDARATFGHSGHWDATMQHGAGCPVCIQQRDIASQIDAALARVPTT